MHTLKNDLVEIAINADGSEITIKDLARNSIWQLDPSTIGYHEYLDVPDSYEFMWTGGKIQSPLIPLTDGRVQADSDSISVEYPIANGIIRYTWRLEKDHIDISLNSDAENIAYISLPGSIRPETGPVSAALPSFQGVIVRPGGDPYETTQQAGGHCQMSMSFGAVFTDAAALLTIQESVTDWVCTHGRDEKGAYLLFEQAHCPVDGWYERKARLILSDPDITSICKTYRRRIIERGEFKTWDEKIAEKPILENLFGALIAFIGYNKTDQIDYAQSAQRLKDYGFDTVMYYSTRICNYSLDFKMGGDDPIWLSDDELDDMRKIDGTLLSPWVWSYEALDDGSEEINSLYRKTQDGIRKKHWQIDDFIWYEVCIPYQIDYMKKRLAGDMSKMDWLHYDVTAMRPGLVCFNKDHALHDSKPMNRRMALDFTRELLSASTVGNRIVSSEGFQDRYAGHYDIGSSKIYPAWGDASFIPVPMTMLVFHDSCLHDWWEVHNYNSHPGFKGDSDQIVGVNSCGRPEQKAAMDALYGCPPNLFPFGKQYSWVNIETRETYSYIVRLDDEEVQQAIKAALPVAKHHKKIGKCELVSFEFITDDYTVQKTVFSDGTAVIANISDTRVETSEFGLLEPYSWITV